MESQKPLASTSALLARLWQHLSKHRRRQLMLLLPMMLLSAGTEIISLGAVLPFLSVLIAPEQIFSYPLVSRFAAAFGIISPAQLVLPLTSAFVLAALFAGAMRMFVLWLNTRLAFAIGADLSIDAYRRTLYQPYRVHVARNSSEVISGISGKVGAASSAIYQTLILISSTVMMGAVLLAVLAINPLIAFLAAIGFGGCYASISWVSRRWLKRNSSQISREQTRLIQALQEGLGGIRDVLLDGSQPFYCDVYKQANHPFRRAQASNVFIAGSPRFLMESVGMAMIAVLAYFLSQQNGGMGTALPVLGALALAAQRLLPALQNSYAAWATISGSHASLSDALDMLDQPISSEALLPPPEPLMLRKSISLKSIRFRYTEESPYVLDNFNLFIPRGARVGLVGRTGSGKSTVLDLIMGLLSPTDGEFLVDDQPILGNSLRAWQRTIAHVPQSIYLSDATLAENIAFGVPRDDIEMARVRLAASQAHISDFIERSPQGYEALVGERGIRLSGGQRQRIGIARALYKRASVLVFDEATSALDNSTEQSVMDAVNMLDRDLTILIVAHRLSTVKRCEFLVELDCGHVVAQGTYDELLAKSITFRAMAEGIS